MHVARAYQEQAGDQQQEASDRQAHGQRISSRCRSGWLARVRLHGPQWWEALGHCSEQQENGNFQRGAQPLADRGDAQVSAALRPESTQGILP
jgi:hypothetical protein